MHLQSLIQFSLFICLSSFSLATASYASESKSNTEKAGDLFLILLPSTTFASTYFINDTEGMEEFSKGFLANAGITYGLKSTINEDRPDQSGDDSFPSGHTSITFQSAVFVHKRYGLNYAIPAYIAATFTGWSRVDAKKHYTRDVLAGALVGSCSSLYFTSNYQNLSVLPIVEKDIIGLQLAYKW